MSAPTDTAATPGPTPTPGDPAVRLPTTVVPRHYRLTLVPDLAAATFGGQVSIDVDVTEAVPEIVCNAAELDVSSALLERDGTTTPATRITLDGDDERVTLGFASPVGAGPATLHLDFSGVLNDKLHGFYRSTFTTDEGTEHVIATTQMEATDARRAFPCWDEPDRKATFDVTLVVDDGLAAYSNGAVAEETPEPGTGRRRVRFATTMKMSTYLVAFVVGPLEATAPTDVDGVPLRIVHPPGKAHLTGYALEVGAHALRFFTDYFGIPYPSDKLDLVAIPDFAFGAMENLGCVTFRETALLVDPGQASRVELERVADVICHEIAHMWFGDLVTMRWWNGIWLNEAFATFMEVLAVDAFRPEWHRWVSFGIEREAALAVDGLHATRSVEYPVARPEDAQGMFDVLTYQKGGSVLRMLERFIGADTFRDGIRDYLRRHAYGNTETADLWDALGRASGQPVGDIMDTWILQGGYPLIEVADGGTLRQAPFSYSGAPGGAIGADWQVPVLTRPLSDPAAAAGPVLLTADAGGEGDPRGDGSGILVNAGGWGYYRVAYPPATLERLATDIATLEPLERVNLVSDAWAAALAGRTPLADIVRLARALVEAEDRDPSVWSIVLGAVSLWDRAVPDGDRPQFEEAVRTLLVPVATDLGWDPAPTDDERTPALRAAVLSTLGTTGVDTAVRERAETRFAESLRGGGALHPDTEAAVLDIVAAHGGAAEFDAFVERMRHPSTPQEEVRYLYALAAFRAPALAERAFDMALGEVRTQNAPFLIQLLLVNRVCGPATWGRVETAWDALVERFPANIVPRMLDGVRGLCRPPGLADEVVEFIGRHPVPGGAKTIEQTLERLAVNVAFVERHGDGLARLLRTSLAPLAD